MKRSRDADPSHREYLAKRPSAYRGYERTSRHLVMRDGTKIAIDVCIPKGLVPGAKIPTILRQTRYYRRFLVRKHAQAFLPPSLFDPLNAPMRDLFTSRGYAWVDVDVRGSGASFGERPCPWYIEGEVKDGAEIVDWIVAQPWSNGRVGSTGNSYDGTTAEFLATNRHEAVRAIAPRCSLFDVYTDVAFPGGLHHYWFTETWERANEALDRNAPGDFIGTAVAFGLYGARDPKVGARLGKILDRDVAQSTLRAVLGGVLGGVPAVDEDRDGSLLAAAIASHGNNYNVHSGAVHMTYRDDSPPNAPIEGFTSEYFSPSTYVEATGSAAVLSYGGWFDAAYANGASKRHRRLAGTARASDHRLLIGPWVHGGNIDMDPDTKANATAFDHPTELLRFFDRHLAPHVEGEDTAIARYYVMGSGRWRASTTFPPPGTRTLELAFGEGRRLLDRRKSGPHQGHDTHAVDLTTGTGKRSRWRTLVSPMIHADGVGRTTKGLLAYESDPLEDDLEVAGHPVVELAIRSSVSDGAILAYLEDVDREGRGRLVTEGGLRTIHRTRVVREEGDASPPRVEASFLRKDALRLEPDEPAVHAIELLPLAMLFRRGHKIRLLLGGADVDHFATPEGALRAKGRVTWRIDRAGSRLFLPVAQGG